MAKSAPVKIEGIYGVETVRNPELGIKVYVDRIGFATFQEDGSIDLHTKYDPRPGIKIRIMTKEQAAALSGQQKGDLK